MGKGGGGGGGPSDATAVRPLPWLFNQNPAGQPSIMQGLADLTTEESQFLNEQGGINTLYRQGIGELQGQLGAGLGTNPWGLESEAIAQEQALAPQYQQNINRANSLTDYGQQQIQAGNNQVSQLENGTGLYKSQQAYVDQAVKSGQAAVQQQLAAEGLTSSTQNAMLQNQVAQSGAATAGQLTQGNIQLAQQGVQLAQQLTMGEQQLSAGNLQALNAMWSNVQQQAGGMNASAFQQAVGGAGILGQFFNQIGQTYGVQLQGLDLQLKQELGQAEVNAGLIASENQASASGKSSMMGGLGSIMGKSGGGGGSSGGLFGSIGSLFGAGGAAAGGTAAAIGIGSAGGSISSGVGAVALLAVA